MVRATNHYNAIVMMASLEMVAAPPNEPERPIVPIFCLTHGTVTWDRDITYQLRSADGFPEREPLH